MKLTIEACRVNVGASKKEMANFVGVSESTVRSWEKGRSIPKATHVIKLLAFFASKGFPVELNDLKFLS